MQYETTCQYSLEILTMFCSTIIATIGRNTLDRTVESALVQGLAVDDYEVIVVNDSGEQLAVGDWANDPRVIIVDTQRWERSVARNTGAAIARGRFLHFIDDDDWLVPGSLQAMRAQCEQATAQWVYGDTELIDRSGKRELILKPRLQGNVYAQVMAGEWIPLQASLIRRDAFWQAGGFDPHLARGEDNDLLRRIALLGDVAPADQLFAVVGMGEAGSTTEQQRGWYAPARVGIERLLLQDVSWQRLWTSADDAYWQGRIVRLYATSAYWNLRQRQLGIGLLRLVTAGAALLRASRHLFNPALWRAITRQHAGVAFQVNEAETVDATIVAQQEIVQ